MAGAADGSGAGVNGLVGGWLIVTAAVFSYMRGTVHQYYSVALAPPIAALVAVGVKVLWDRRDHRVARLGLAAIAVSDGGWGFVLLDRDPMWLTSIRYIALAGAIAAGAALATRRAARLALGSAIVIGLLPTTTYAIDISAHSHTGPIPSVGPSGTGADVGLPAAPRVLPAGAFPRNGEGFPASGSAFFPATGEGFPDIPGFGGKGGPGAAFGGATLAKNSELAKMLRASRTRWAAAVSSTSSAASLELSTGGSPVIGIGGFTSSDPYPTPADFESYVRHGEIHYYIRVDLARGLSGRHGPVRCATRCSISDS